MRKLANSSEMLDQDQDEVPANCSSHRTIGIMTGAGVAAHFWATLSIHIDSHGRDRVAAVDICATRITLYTSNQTFPAAAALNSGYI